jgi:hypothetical protein
LSCSAWILIGGITLLGLVFVTPEFRKMGDNIDFETVLPYVINRFLPAGLVGVTCRVVVVVLWRTSAPP